MDRARQILRSGAWLTPERIRLAAIALLIASAASFLFLVVTAKSGVDLQGRPLGTDFSNVYAAGTYVLEGNPDAPFDSLTQYTASRRSSGRRRNSTAGTIRPIFCSSPRRWRKCPSGWR